MARRMILAACAALVALVCAGASAPTAGAQFQTGADPAVDAGDIPPTPSPQPTAAPTASPTPDDGGLAPREDGGKNANGGQNDDNGGPGGKKDNGGRKGADGGGGGGGGGNRGDVSGGVAGNENGDALPLRESQGGSLPFTGLDLALIVLLGLGLLAAGTMLRLGDRFRAARRS